LGTTESQAIAVKAKKILSTLSSFEEATADCVSNMLVRFSNLDYTQGSIQAFLFINYIESLFFAVDQIQCREEQLSLTSESSFPRTQSQEELYKSQNRETKQLAKRIVYFLSLLSSSQTSASGGPAGGRDSVTKEMISLVTTLASSLKSVIRGALVRAFMLV
jgi:hypothetical protein